MLSMESTSNRMTPPRTVADHGHGDSLAAEDHRRDRRSRAGGDRRAGGDPARRGAHVRRRDRAERETLLGRCRARQPWARRAARGVKIVLFGDRGKVGRVLGPALTGSGHELVGLEEAEAAVDFTRPDAVVENVRRCLEARVPCVIGTTGFDQGEVDRAAREAGVACFHAPELRHRRGSDDALRRGGGTPPAASGDRRAPRRYEAATRLRARRRRRRSASAVIRRSIPSAFPAWSRTRRCSSEGRGSC